MKTIKIIRKLFVGVVCAGLGASYVSAEPLTSAFNYQGQLMQDGAPAAGQHGIRFELYDVEDGGDMLGDAVDLPAVDVANGLFNVKLDFGVVAFNGERRFLQITVDGQPLAPRTELNAVPYAMYALNSPQAGGPGGEGFWSPSGVNIYNNNDGYVGIGTNDPQWSLDVSARQIKLGLEKNGGGQLLLANNAGDNKIYIEGLSSNALDSASEMLLTGLWGANLPQLTFSADVTRAAGRIEANGQDGLRVSGYQPFMTLNDTNAGRRTFLQGVGGGFSVVTESRRNQPAPFFVQDGSNNIGMGDYYFNPARQLHVFDSDLFVARFEGTHAEASVVENRSYTSGAVWEWSVCGSTSAFGLPAGSLYFYKQGNGGPGLSITPDNFAATIACADFKMGHNSRRGAPGRALVDGGDTLVLNFANDWARTRVDSLLQVKALQILGGADLAEPFDIASSSDKVKPEAGMVVVIDDAKDGQLEVSTSAYDRKVAGIISGAGGINPGVTLQQEGSIADGSQNVALSGRVYCWVDADANGPVAHGDLLTTSNTPGHAMKVTDHDQASGAIIGKAMSRLESGKGLVLVLVNLQ